MDNTEQRIKQVMADVFDMPAETILENVSQDNLEGWDSLKHLDLVVALEEEFEITIPVEEVGNLISFKLIVVIIKELLSVSKQ
ncbi:acyl carrier protein [Odoribacter splanchnicus]|uniref:acyl carrier protein n=1 Tax=Odoribacter splanchnicus TaxID=28118 RepID=UPI000E53FED8|nr:acyl carrier protein [Odoribacter splanchnicus]NUN81336.1 acyl carrier protein [Odoribacter splanchnicus]RHL78880.1 acyl carrier protein [Odoribacter splanchnicus]